MFCVKCGKELPYDAAYCSFCGTKVINEVNTGISSNNTLVPAKCSNCGGLLKINSSIEEAICPFCNTKFIVSKAISNYNINTNAGISFNNATVNINGAPSITNLNERAYDFEKSGEIYKAIRYYNKVLDLDANNIFAKQALYRIKNETLFSVPASFAFTSGTLQLKYDSIVLASKRGKERIIKFSEIIDVYKSLGSLAIRTKKAVPHIYSSQDFDGSFVLSCSILGKAKVVDIVSIINNARKGVFPARK